MLVETITKKRPIKPALLSLIPSDTSPQDRAFIQELTYGVCRWFFDLEIELDNLLGKPLRKRDFDIKCLLLVGLYQLIHLDTPDHAVVKETAGGANTLKKGWARGLVNATLRTAIRHGLRTRGVNDANLMRNQPAWLVEQLNREWPAKCLDIFKAFATKPPLTLRVNERKSSRDEYLRKLLNLGIPASKTEHSARGIQIRESIAVNGLPGFLDGVVSVQDEGAQLAALLLAPTRGEKVLDACAAPGGKSGHILEILGDGENLTLLDVDQPRVALIRENIQRLNISQPRILLGSGCCPKDWWDGELYDKILIDAPCSASGIIRRQPDIKFHRELDDIEVLVALQLQLLSALWPLLKAGGKLIYATCSIFSRENDAVVSAFQTSAPDCQVEMLSAQWGHPTTHGRQILPGESAMDGFYYSKMYKTGMPQRVEQSGGI